MDNILDKTIRKAGNAYENTRETTKTQSINSISLLGSL